MTYSRQRAVSDGTLQRLDVAIQYMRRADIFVLFDGVLTDAWAWAGNSDAIQFPVPVPSGVEVTVLRRSRINQIIHQFNKGAKFVNSSVDEDFQQLLFLAQEYTEGGGQSEFFTDVDMHGFRVINLGRATQPGDAIPLFQYNEDLGKAPEALALAQAATADLAAYMGVVRSGNGAGQVGFRQRGGNAGLRTLQAKAEETFTLEDFQAGMPGVSDAQAWTWANAACSVLGKSIELTRVYSVSTSIFLSPGVSVFGKSRVNTGITLNGGAELRIRGDVGTKNGGNLTLRSLLISHSGTDGGIGVSISECKDILFDDVEFYHADVTATKYSYLTFSNCVGFDYDVVSFGDVNTLNEALKFLGGRGSNMQILSTETTDVVISDFHMLGPASTISVHRGNNPPGLYVLASLSNVVVDSTELECISFTGASFRMSGTFTSGGRTAGKPGVFLDDCVESTLSAVTSRYCGSHGLQMVNCRTIDVSGKFADNQMHGIQMSGCKDIHYSVYAGNTEGWYGGSYVQQYGIVDSSGDCTNVIVEGCHLVGNAAGPVYLPNSGTKYGINYGYTTSNNGNSDVVTVAGAARIPHGLSLAPRYAQASAVTGLGVDTQVTGVDGTYIYIRVRNILNNANVDGSFSVMWSANSQGG